jgi:hypothetical protein
MVFLVSDVLPDISLPVPLPPPPHKETLLYWGGARGHHTDMYVYI